MIRLHHPDELEGSVFFKRNNQGHAAKCGNNGHSVFKRVDRAILPFLQAANRLVTVDTDYEAATKGRGLLEIGDMTTMQNIETAIGKYYWMLEAGKSTGQGRTSL